MARFEDMLPDARAGLPAAPDIIILGALKRAAAELCRQSWVWKQSLPAFNAVPGKSQYTLAAPSGARVEAILVANYNGAIIDVWREQDLLNQPGSTGTPTMCSLSMSAQALTLYPTPSTNDTAALNLYAALVPLPNANTLPDDIAVEFRPGIVAGAKAELMAVSPGMPYHNPQGAAVQGEIAYRWITRAKQRHQGGGVNLGAQPRRFI